MDSDRSKGAGELKRSSSDANGRTSTRAVGADIDRAKFVGRLHRRMEAANGYYRDEHKQ